ncbi:uncharacterized protein DEA37_0008266 [Paragonimus westermani]|uniref:Uncharacterized protein n=1 Tax=Paragonimus westermani TaxID=34504 RepID=A0A5J4N9A8_9TREM|nr:uncharacterized protein DEA37_0008266 [Paragonimus westermani]
MWLRLPKDTTLAFMHSKIDGHCLGIPCLETTILFVQRSKCERLVNSGTTEVANIVQCKAVVSDLVVANAPISVYGIMVNSKSEEDKAWREALVRTHDCVDLANVQVDKGGFYWLRNPRHVFPRLFIRGLQLRGGLLTTKVRSSRGGRRAAADSCCRGLCGCPESIGHILQKYSITHEARCARHNRVVQLIGKLLRARGRSVFVEPIIPSASTFCKPDLVVRSGSSILVMDVTTVSSRRLVESWHLKVSKYDNPATNVMIASVCTDNNSESYAVKHTPVVLSDMGEFYQKSGLELRKIGFTDRDISDICLLTTIGSLKCYDVYMQTT